MLLCLGGVFKVDFTTVNIMLLLTVFGVSQKWDFPLYE